MDPSLSFYKHCIASYTAPVWSTNASDSSFKIQTAQNAALRTATGAHKMASIDHLHQGSLTLRVKDHSDMLYVQYIVKETLHSRHHSTVQRCTLSQLRSGHYHLLQNYKHRVLGEPSDICTDCGASPQDVRHLFVCTTHPTDLSPEDLWRKPVGSIRASSYLDNGNLD